MTYLLAEIWFFLLLAFVLGMFVQWFFCCRGKKDEADKQEVAATPLAAANNVTATPEVQAKTTAQPVTATPAAPVIDESWKPMGFAAAPESVDDLKRIKGVGAVLEKTLNELGVYQFKQIAEWTTDNAKWVDNFLSFPGRIDRENWIEQAQVLSEGGKTEFSNRVDKGEVDYKA